MSKEKRQQAEFLKEIDKFFQEKGLSEYIERFLEAEETVSKIHKVADVIIEKLKTEESIDSNNDLYNIVRKIRSGLEKDKTTLNDYIIASFKVSLAWAIKMVIQFTDDIDEQEYFLTTIKESIMEKGLEDIEGICAQLIWQNGQTLMTQLFQ